MLKSIRKSLPSGPSNVRKMSGILSKVIMKGTSIAPGKIISWQKVERHFGRIRSRLGALGLAALVVLAVCFPIMEQMSARKWYHLTSSQLELVGKTDISLAKQLTYDPQSASYLFNREVIENSSSTTADPVAIQQKAAIGAENESNAKTYALTVQEDFSKGTTYYDANSKLSFSLLPQFQSMKGRIEQGHLVFPLSDSRKVVYTLKNNGLKEDILLSHATTDTEKFTYHFNLPKSLEVRTIPGGEGAIGIYSADPALFGNISYAAESDRARVEKARENSEKTNLVFALPAPVITSVNGRSIGEASARFELNSNNLTVVAENLLSAGNQPLSIDPSVVVTSTTDFEYGGNNEGNINFSTSGQLTRGETTGGDVNAWASASNLSYTVESASSVFYNNYIYVIGGGVRTPQSTYTTVSYATINANGTLGTWNTTTGLPTGSIGGQATAYNGYLYYLGGDRGSGLSTEVNYARINVDGTIGTWNVTTNIPSLNQSFGLSTANGYIYILGGNTGTGTAGYLADVYYAKILPLGVVGTWTATTSLSYPRSSLTANIYNGYLYAFGGANAAGAVTDVQYAAINRDDGSIGNWMTTKSFTTARYGHISAIYNGYAYVYGGWSGAYPTTTQYAQVNANGSLGNWITSASNFTNGRTNAVGGVYKGYLYIGGGWNGTVGYGDFQYTSIVPLGKNVAFTNNTNSISTARRYTQSVAAYGWLFVLGGDTGSAASAAVGRMPIDATGTLGAYTTTSITQMSASPGPGVRMLFGAFVYDSYLYVLGGCKSTLSSCNTSGNALNTVYSAKITANTGALGAWTQRASFTTARYGFATAVLNGYVYIVGGTANGGGSPLATIEYASFDLSGVVGSWTTASSTYNLPIGLTNFAAAVNGNTLYVAGGCTTGTAAACTAQTNAVYHIKLSGSGGLASTWSSAGADASFTNARYGAGMTVINGVLYLIGGYNGSAYYADTQYAPINANGTVGTWQGGNPISTSALGPSVTSQNGVLYVIGGYNGSAQTTVRYAVVNNGGRGQTGTWLTNSTDISNVYPSGVGYADSVAVNGFIYIIGGTTGTPSLTVAYAPLNADGSVGTWATTSDLQVRRLQHAVFAYNGYVYAAGGGSSGGAKLSSVEFAKLNSDGTLGAWTYTSSLNDTWGGLRGIDGAAYNGYVYITGGENATSEQTEAQYAQVNSDGTLGSWIATSTFTTARQLHNSVAVNGYLYVIGGWISGTYFNDVQMAPINSDGSLGSWSYTSPMPGAGKGMIAAIYNGYLYVYAGNSNTGVIGLGTNIWYAPINADGTIGDWQVVIGSNLTTSRASASGAIYNGFMYMLGGNTSPFYTDVQYAPVDVLSHQGQYSKMVSLNSATTISSIAYNGFLANGPSDIRYSAYSANGTLLATGRGDEGALLNACEAPVASASYVLITLVLDDTYSGSGGSASSGNQNTKVSDITIDYISSHPLPHIRLRHGQTLQEGVLGGLDTCMP